MKLKLRQLLYLIFALTFAVSAGIIFSRPFAEPTASAVVTAKGATAEPDAWGTFYTYFQGETFGTKDNLAGVAEIKPGQEIHPPHQHADEEFLMVIEGEGAWHLNGEEFAAHPGDMLYAAPWDMHGIKNTGEKPLKFVLWKWNNKGIPSPPQPTASK